MQSCTQLHQQSPPSRRNNKNQTLFDGGLPCTHPPGSCTSSVSVLQDKHVPPPYGSVRKINYLGIFMCRAQTSDRRNAIADISDTKPFILITILHLQSTRGQPQPWTLTELRATLEFQRPDWQLSLDMRAAFHADTICGAFQHFLRTRQPNLIK